MPNNPPTLVGLSPFVVFGENAVNAAPALIDTDVTFADAEGNFTGGVVIVSGLLAEDRVSLNHQGFGAGQIGLFGVNVTYGGIAIGTFSGGVGGTFTISLNSSATSAAVDALLQNLAYANVSDSPTATRTLTILIQDGDGAPVVRETVIEVTAESDVPTLDDVAPSVSFLENAVNAAPALLDADVDFGLGSAGLTGGQLIVSGLLSEDRVSILAGGSLTVAGNAVSFGGNVIGTFSGGQGTSFVVTFTAAADATNVEALIERLAYANASDTPTPSRTLHFNIVDGAGGALDGPLVLTSFPVNPLAFVPGNVFNGAPAFVDLDADGDLDLVVGDLYGLLRTYRNDGGGHVELVGPANPFGSIDIGFNSAPAFVDLDGDGDQDLILGADAIPGIVQAYRNDSGTYVLLTGAEDPFAGMAFDRNMTPAAADVDGDGDIDLVFGSRSNSTPGALDYFENDGGSYVERTGTANPFGSAVFGGYVAPAWIDLDGDGDLDLAVCSLASGLGGAIRVWRNDGGGSFTELTGSANPFGAIDLTDTFPSHLAFADLDGDDDLDTVIGTGLGAGLLTYRNDASFGPSIAVNVAAEGDVPSLADLAASAGFAENAVNAGPALIDANVAFYAGTGGVAGATLTVSGLLAEDRVSILSGGPITVSGTSLLHLGLEIGTLAGGVGGDLTITFNAAASSAGIDAVIERLAYANASDTPTAARTLTIQFVDGLGATLAGGAQAITINVTPGNDAPLLTGLTATLDVAENQANAVPVRLDADVVFADPDGGMAGGTLTVAGLLAEDRVGIRDEGLGAGTIALFGSIVTHDGVAIGTVSGGSGATFTVTLNAAASNVAVDALIQNLTYANVSHTPTPNRVLTLSVADAAGAPVSSLVSVSVADEDDAPLIGNLDGDSGLFSEGGAPVPLDTGADATVGDVDSSAFGGGSLSVSIAAGGVAAEDRLGLATGGTVTIAGTTVSVGGTAIGTITSDGTGGNDLAIAFTALATPLLVQELVRALTYANSNLVDPDTATRSIEIVLVDDTGASVAIMVEAAVASSDTPAIAANDSVTVAENQIATGNLFADNGSGADADGDGPALAVASVNGLAGAVGLPLALASGARLTVNANGTYSYDPNGKFNTLTSTSTGQAGAVNTSAIDSFTYQLAGGGTATVTITINGVASAQDRLEGNGGDNVITGTSEGEFFFVVQGGDDDLAGFNGNDVFLFGGTLDGDDEVDGGGGTDQIALQGDYSGGLALGTGVLAIESLALLAGSDTRFGDPGANVYDYDITTRDVNVAAGAVMTIDANKLRAGEDFTFDGLAETDGSFFVYGGLGTDNLTGGEKNDVFLFGAEGQWGPTDRIVGGDGSGDGHDQLVLRGDYTIVFGAGQLTSIESIALVSAHDTRFGAMGSNYDYALTLHDDSISLGKMMIVDGSNLRATEALTVHGGSESDGTYRIYGGRGSDTITAGQGNDLLVGGGGGDTLTGGLGVDTFAFRSIGDSTPAAPDSIEDFTNGERIDLSQIDAIAATPANERFTFVAAGAFTNSAGQLIATSVGGSTWLVEGDVNGDSSADIAFYVTAIDSNPITAADFVL